MIDSILHSLLKGINGVIGSADTWETIGGALAIIGLILAAAALIGVCIAIVSTVLEKLS